MENIKELLEQRAGIARRASVRASDIMKSHHIGFIKAYIIAQDLEWADVITDMVKSRELSPVKAVWSVGSFARLQWAAEHLPEDQLYKMLPEIWTSSDFYTNHDFFWLWKTAFEKNGGTVYDNNSVLPEGELVTVYRGQNDPPGARGIYGYSWSLNEAVASQFAKGTREKNPSPAVIKGLVKREDILAYLTGRDEDEIIVDPVDVMDKIVMEV